MLKIKSIKTKKISNLYKGKKVYGNKSSLIIIIETNKKNLQGFGETYLSVYIPNIIKSSLNFFSKKLVNQNPLKIEKILDNLEIPFVTHNGFFRGLINGIEIALWDIKAKHLKKPLFKILNNKSYRKNVACYASSGALKLKPNQLKIDVENVINDGFKAYKMRVGSVSWKKDLIRIKSVKNALKSNFLMIDAIMGSHKKKWNINETIKKVNQLKKFDPIWIEEPLSPFNLINYKILKSKTKLPIAFGEQFTTFNEFLHVLNYNCSDYIQPDITMVGYVEAIKISSALKKFKKKIALHVWGSPLSLLSNLHFALAYKKVNWIEVPYTNFHMLNNKLNNNLTIKNGKISFKDENFYGLGFKIN